MGSVGTRCCILLLLGRDNRDPLFLQIKEAETSVFEPLLGAQPLREPRPAHRRGPASHAGIERHLPRLGPAEHDIHGAPRDFYVRQLCDRKVGVEVERSCGHGLAAYAVACGWTLARAHARSGDRIAIAAYLGESDDSTAPSPDSPLSYADRNELDHQALARSVDEGRIAALEGV